MQVSYSPAAPLQRQEGERQHAEGYVVVPAEDDRNRNGRDRNDGAGSRGRPLVRSRCLPFHSLRIQLSPGRTSAAAESGLLLRYDSAVARLADRVSQNVPGDFFVDASCIACDTCRRIAPGVFGGGEDDTAFVRRQPPTPEEERRALMALVACPVAAIGTAVTHAAAVAAAARAFPEPIAEEGVYHCGYAAESSFGAASWLVVRASGNVLVDSPRFAVPLLTRIRQLGGVRFLFLTHRDDVADHARWATTLGCERVLHARDAGGRTLDVERRIEGDAPVALGDEAVVIAQAERSRWSEGAGHRARQTPA